MSLVFTEEETILHESVRKMVSDLAPVSNLRELRNAGEPGAYASDLWKDIAQMGLAGIIIPEAFGGAEFGYRGAGIVIEELGRNLSATPFLSTSIIAATSILAAGTDQQKEAFLPKIAAGEDLFCLAFNEGPHYNPSKVDLTATQKGSDYILTGKKSFVLDGGIADWVIVSAKTSDDGVSLFVIPRDMPGISTDNLNMVDSRNSAHITFESVLVPAASLLGEREGGQALLDHVLDRAAIALSAEMLGSSQAAFETTLEYLKERKQFGRLLGSFQALQHRASEMLCEIELSRAVTFGALNAIDKDETDISRLASLSKATVNETYHKVASEGVQMHGGVGMTDEYDIGLYLKRARVAEKTLGSTHFHKSRYARLSGY